MTYLAMLHLWEGPFGPSMGMWAFLTISSVVMFGIFIPVVSWIEGRRKEREAFYKADTIRRLAESSGEGAKAAVDLLREQDRQQRSKTREGRRSAASSMPA